MPLTPGARIGLYEIVGSLGAGGMGEVYRARDPKLQRDVAIKVLPELFAADPDRLARFEREAQSVPQGRELYLRRGSQVIAMSWDEKDDRFVTTSERIVGSVAWPRTTFESYFAVAPDGRVLALAAARDEAPPRINIVLNWAESPKAR